MTLNRGSITLNVAYRVSHIELIRPQVILEWKIHFNESQFNKAYLMWRFNFLNGRQELIGWGRIFNFIETVSGKTCISDVCRIEKWMLHKEVMSCDVIPVSVRSGQCGQGLLEEKTLWTEMWVVWSNPGLSELWYTGLDVCVCVCVCVCGEGGVSYLISHFCYAKDLWAGFRHSLLQHILSKWTEKSAKQRFLGKCFSSRRG